jgi:circadian clock protein KaiC
MAEVLVLAELNAAGGGVRKTTLEALTAARALGEPSAVVLGAPGTGKTTAGLHFVVEGARQGQPGLVATFYETPDRLIEKADAFGLELGRQVHEGRVQILWQPRVELLGDAWAHGLLRALARHRPERLFVESLDDLTASLTPDLDRAPAFLTALTNELRAGTVTSLFSTGVQPVTSSPLDMPVPALSATMENIILLRYVELGSQLHRLISIVKMRDSDYDSAIRRLSITAQGLALAEPFDQVEPVITRSANPTRPPADEPLGDQPDREVGP